MNKLDLMSIMGFPGGINIDLLYTNSVVAPFSRYYSLKFYDFYKNSIVMEKKDRCAMFGCNNDRRFPDKYVAKDHTSSASEENQKFVSGLARTQGNFRRGPDYLAVKDLR